MKAEKIKYSILLLLVAAVASLSSCAGRSEKPSGNQAPAPATADAERPGTLIKMISPEENAGFRLHESIKIILEATEKGKSPDSVKIYFDSNYITSLRSAPWEYILPGTTTKETGRKSIKVIAFSQGAQSNPITRFMIIYSDVVPVKYGYKVIHTYPHDRGAFTQGIVYDGGNLFEGTGQKGSSTLREVELATGKVIRQHNLDASLFGEGIAIYKNRIYEVTWEDKIGFIYDKATFNVLNKINYQTEGWGLTTVDDKIAMSDGSNIISFHEAEMFTEVSEIEVYDNERKVEKLNELEYINGEIWANIWMTDMIARIEPASGKILGYVDLKGLLPEKEREVDTDVLNGIAFDKQGDRIFVTGKNWPHLYEIVVVR